MIPATLFDAVSELLEQHAVRIAGSLTRTSHIDKLSTAIGVSIGGAIYPRDSQTEAGLLKVADQNRYRARQAEIDYPIGKPE